MTTEEKIQNMISHGHTGRVNSRAHIVPYHNAGQYTLYLHHTSIVTWDQNRTAIYAPSDWLTPTTKRYINHVLPTNRFVFQQNHTWSLHPDNVPIPLNIWFDVYTYKKLGWNIPPLTPKLLFL